VAVPTAESTKVRLSDSDVSNLDLRPAMRATLSHGEAPSHPSGGRPVLWSLVSNLAPELGDHVGSPATPDESLVSSNG